MEHSTLLNTTSGWSFSLELNGTQYKNATKRLEDLATQHLRNHHPETCQKTGPKVKQATLEVVGYKHFPEAKAFI